MKNKKLFFCLFVLSFWLFQGAKALSVTSTVLPLRGGKIQPCKALPSEITFGTVLPESNSQKLQFDFKDADFLCVEDLSGEGCFRSYIQASDLVNEYGKKISNKNIAFVQNAEVHTLAGWEVASILSPVINEEKSLADPVAFLEENLHASNGVVGAYGVQPTLSVEVPAYPSPGEYSGMLTLTLQSSPDDACEGIFSERFDTWGEDWEHWEQWKKWEDWEKSQNYFWWDREKNKEKMKIWINSIFMDWGWVSEDSWDVSVVFSWNIEDEENKKNSENREDNKNKKNNEVWFLWENKRSEIEELLLMGFRIGSVMIMYYSDTSSSFISENVLNIFYLNKVIEEYVFYKKYWEIGEKIWRDNREENSWEIMGEEGNDWLAFDGVVWVFQWGKRIYQALGEDIGWTLHGSGDKNFLKKEIFYGSFSGDVFEKEHIFSTDERFCYQIFTDSEVDVSIKLFDKEEEFLEYDDDSGEMWRDIVYIYWEQKSDRFSVRVKSYGDLPGKYTLTKEMIRCR